MLGELSSYAKRKVVHDRGHDDDRPLSRDPFLAGYISWDPKWPHWGWIWVLNNLLIVSMTEEIFFRGYLQKGIERLFSSWRHGSYIALSIASILFGLFHAEDGSAMVIFAACAGLGYGLAWRLGGLKPAILTHFALNLVHFLFLTYPALA